MLPRRVSKQAHGTGRTRSVRRPRSHIPVRNQTILSTGLSIEHDLAEDWSSLSFACQVLKAWLLATSDIEYGHGHDRVRAEECLVDVGMDKAGHVPSSDALTALGRVACETAPLLYHAPLFCPTETRCLPRDTRIISSDSATQTASQHAPSRSPRLEVRPCPAPTNKDDHASAGSHPCIHLDSTSVLPGPRTHVEAERSRRDAHPRTPYLPKSSTDQRPPLATVPGAVLSTAAIPSTSQALALLPFI